MAPTQSAITEKEEGKTIFRKKTAYLLFFPLPYFLSYEFDRDGIFDHSTDAGDTSKVDFVSRRQGSSRITIFESRRKTIGEVVRGWTTIG